MHRIIFALLALGVSAISPAPLAASPLSEITDEVRTLCSDPTNAGESWSISGNAQGYAGINLKFLKLTSVGGDVHFTKEEWSGVQRVLAKDQAEVYDSYRKCVLGLTPQFLAKVH